MLRMYAAQQCFGSCLLVRSPLAVGLLAGKYGPDSTNVGRRAAFDFPPVDKDKAWQCVASIRLIAQKHATNVASIALAYVLAKPFVTSVIIGAKRLEQVAQNLAAVDIELDADDLAALDKASQLNPQYPRWMLDGRRRHACLQVSKSCPLPFSHPTLKVSS